ncbi:MAG TPA: hypothetical protein VHC98_04140 [Candidatus Saccharimonadales bacterium]|nr:hypothetical protein [Candidatus Saccharimonadales bacterium]
MPALTVWFNVGVLLASATAGAANTLSPAAISSSRRKCVPMLPLTFQNYLRTIRIKLMAA